MHDYISIDLKMDYDWKICVYYIWQETNEHDFFHTGDCTCT